MPLKIAPAARDVPLPLEELVAPVPHPPDDEGTSTPSNGASNGRSSEGEVGTEGSRVTGALLATSPQPFDSTEPHSKSRFDGIHIASSESKGRSTGLGSEDEIKPACAGAVLKLVLAKTAIIQNATRNVTLKSLRMIVHCDI